MSRGALLAAALMMVFASISVRAQTSESLNGDFAGTLGPLTLKLHVKAAADGKLTCTLDSPNQGALGIPCADVAVEGASLSFKVPTVNGTWKGKIENGGDTLAGTLA
jgi:D-alanyl-D-alanine-carboxypeptidase/D-alanyl-D-alanine-endopeptidase